MLLDRTSFTKMICRWHIPGGQTYDENWLQCGVRQIEEHKPSRSIGIYLQPNTHKSQTTKTAAADVGRQNLFGSVSSRIYSDAPKVHSNWTKENENRMNWFRTLKLETNAPLEKQAVTFRKVTCLKYLVHVRFFVCSHAPCKAIFRIFLFEFWCTRPQLGGTSNLSVICPTNYAQRFGDFVHFCVLVHGVGVQA